MQKRVASFGAGMGAAVVGFLCLSSPASSQEDKMLRPPQVNPEATFYRDVNFNGPAVYVNEPKTNLQLNWRVNSIRIKSGQWELCERPNFRGTCRTYDRDTIVLGTPFRGREIQSIRPTGWWQNPHVPGNNPSLRGMAAQFYPAPAQNGYRIPACERGGSATAQCAASTADRFCAAMGWRHGARQSMETVAGRVYLADVLCSNTGH